MRNYLLKYAVDRILAAIFVVILSPLMGIILVGMRIEAFLDSEYRCSPLFKEIRVSQGKPFTMYKFRVLKQSVIRKMTPSDFVWYLQFDRRNTTRVGKILLKFYLDELPQLFNILKGEMSLVGPRPRILPVYERDLKKGYSASKFLRAGVTGLHQLTKSSGKPDSDPVQSEVYYEKCKIYGPIRLLLYDIEILAKTLLIIVAAKGL